MNQIEIEPKQKLVLTFFKPSGKFYTTGETEVPASLEMFEIFEMVRHWKNEGVQMPGLTGGWTGPILVTAPGHRNEYPGLIL